MMRRREFITLLGGVTVWPLAARAQQPGMPVVGFLALGSPGAFAERIAALREGLRKEEFVEGRNFAFEFRWGSGGYDSLPALAAALVERRVDVIVAGGAGGTVAKAATTTIPIVALSGGDPIKAGLVVSLNRPEANLTGVALFAFSLGPKRFELLREAVPGAKLIAVLANPTNTNPETRTDTADVEAAARAVGQQVSVLNASTEREIDAAFAAMVRQGAGALLVMADPFLNIRREQIIALAAYHAIPTIYEWRESAQAGGLMSYGSSVTDAYRHVGTYAGRILKGTRPADLPFMRAVKIELVINLKTAKTLGLEIPTSVLARADEVIK